jgi:hypothetical protein
MIFWQIYFHLEILIKISFRMHEIVFSRSWMLSNLENSKYSDHYFSWAWAGLCVHSFSRSAASNFLKTNVRFFDIRHWPVTTIEKKKYAFIGEKYCILRFYWDTRFCHYVLWLYAFVLVMVWRHCWGPVLGKGKSHTRNQVFVLYQPCLYRIYGVKNVYLN